MAHSLSAKKRVRQNLKQRARNRWRKRDVREAIKDYREAILHQSVDEAEQKLRGLYKLLDQVAAKGTFHKNTAARTKSRLAARLQHKKQSEGQKAA
ncbi:MAG: 30S ribosomal protein S20 [Phycisphaeraceae bacterium]